MDVFVSEFVVMLPLRHGDSYYIGRLLNGAYQIVYARNGAEGLEIAAEQMPDLILTDLMMPEMAMSYVGGYVNPRC